MKKVFIVSCIVLGIIWSNKEVSAQKEMNVNFTYGMKFGVPGKTKKIEMIILIPQDIKNKQQITEIIYSQEPVEVFESNGNKYARFISEEPEKEGEILITATLTLYKADYKTLSKKPVLLENVSQKYLLPEKYIESDSELIIKKANELKGKNQLQTLKNIYGFVGTHMTYSHSNRSIGALNAFKTKKGRGADFTDLFIALCRASDIPARYVYGYITDFYNSTQHLWAEVYMENIGWVNFEVIPGNDATFNSIQNKYICLSVVKNDDVLNNGFFYRYKYWGDRIEQGNFFKLNWKK